VTKSYDATSHFESASDEVLELYERITGEKLDLNIEPTDEEEYWWMTIRQSYWLLWEIYTHAYNAED